MSELVAVWLRGLLALFAHGTSVNDDVVLVRSSVDLDRPEPEESHIHHMPPYPPVRKSNTSESTPIAFSRLSYLTGWSLGGSRVEPSRRTTGPTGADTPVGGGGVGLGSGGLSGGAG